MSLAGVHALWARAAFLALSAPVLMAGPIPASAATIGHAMAPAVESESQFEFLSDSQVDALPALPCLHSTPIHCFGADTIRSAYGIQSVLDEGITGKHRTIVIIDAFQNLTIRTDLAMFDSFWNIPAPPSFTIVSPYGVPDFDPKSSLQVGWSQEISIDVEWAHAIAPGAEIVLVQATSEKDTDLLNATRYAIRHHLGDVVSQSFGEAEMCASPDLIQQQQETFQEAAQRRITLLASSGDKGPARQSCDGKSLVLSVSTPASDPNVTGVGGTHLFASGAGAYQSEEAWKTVKGASGGGYSSLYARPDYQALLQPDKNARGVPDVAYNADSTSGFIVVWNGRGGVVGGTSAGTPQWAGIIALADQAGGHRLGAINKTLYRIGESDAYSSAFHDITSGNNDFMGMKGFPARPGWDAVTGLGTPNVANLIPLLIDGEG
jgi:subtilase family serine protease